MMTIIDVANLTRVDLNLLIVFHLLMEERHVTRTAARLRVTQGSVSAALSRLRRLFDDPLFERTHKGMTPTPKALSLAPTIGRVLSTIASELFESPEFDATASHTTFHLAMSDDLEMSLVPYLLAERSLHRWTVNFSIHQTNSSLWRERMDDRRISALVIPTPEHVPAEFRHRTLFSDSYQMLFSPQQFGQDDLNFETFCAAGHIRVSYDAQRGFVDQLFEAEGRVRNVVVSISHFAGVMPLLLANPLIAIVPAYAARAIAATTQLAARNPPITVPRFSIAYVWRGDEESRTDQVWLRSILEGFAPGRA